MSFRGPQEAENGPLEVPGNAKGPFGEFPRIDFGDPPPLEMEQNYLLIFYSQLLKRVPVVLCLGALTSPRETPPLKMEQNSLYWTLIANL